MTTKKRTYPTEFEQEAVRLWETSGKSAMEIKRELGIIHGLLKNWKRQLKNEGQAPFPARRHLTPEQEQIGQLERKLAIAEQEKDILKSSGHHFGFAQYRLQRPKIMRYQFIEDHFG